jgi:hypothetical protein
MADRSQLINDYTETSTSSPLRTRPTDKQMGLGTEKIFTEDTEKKNTKKSNT